MSPKHPTQHADETTCRDAADNLRLGDLAEIAGFSDFVQEAGESVEEVVTSVGTADEAPELRALLVARNFVRLLAEHHIDAIDAALEGLEDNGLATKRQIEERIVDFMSPSEDAPPEDEGKWLDPREWPVEEHAGDDERLVFLGFVAFYITEQESALREGPTPA